GDLDGEAILRQRRLVGRERDLSSPSVERDRELVDLSAKVDAAAVRCLPVRRERAAIERGPVRLGDLWERDGDALRSLAVDLHDDRGDRVREGPAVDGVRGEVAP